MTKNKPRGGEPDGARLLDLARRELLAGILPHLEGDARYRARLIANALKLAAAELEADSAVAEAAILRDLAAAAGQGDTPATAGLTQALRGGALDGNPEVHALLVRLTERRRAALG